MVKLGIQAASAVATASEILNLFEKLHPILVTYIDPVRGLLMPEYFWEAWYTRDQERMKLELERALVKVPDLEKRYHLFSTKEKLAIEQAYCDILEATTSTTA